MLNTMAKREQRNRAVEVLRQHTPPIIYDPGSGQDVLFANTALFDSLLPTKYEYQSAVLMHHC
jgi:hypothetical protein